MGEPVSTSIAIASVAAGAFGTKKTMDEQKKAFKAEQKAIQAQKRIQDIKSKRERTQMIREARIRRAQIMQAGQNSGAGIDSSAALGGAGSIQSQLGSSMAANQNVQSLGNTATNALSQSAASQQKASEISAITNTAVAAGQQFGSFDMSKIDQKAKKLFAGIF